jgi:hypothetical protein
LALLELALLELALLELALLELALLELALLELAWPDLIRNENFTSLMHSTVFPMNGPLPPYWHCTVLSPVLQTNEGHEGPTISAGVKMPPVGHLHFQLGTLGFLEGFGTAGLECFGGGLDF